MTGKTKTKLLKTSHCFCKLFSSESERLFCCAMVQFKKLI